MLRDQFVGWQCRLRQHSVRLDEGRPGPGMAPRVEMEAGDGATPRVVLLLVERDPDESTRRFQHIYRQTRDPRVRRDKALEILRADYFQEPRAFSGVMAALFGPGSGSAAQLMRAGRCVLHFEQLEQCYRIPCRVSRLEPGDPRYEATFWHASLFNPGIPEGSRVVAFDPIWEEASARPPPQRS